MEALLGIMQIASPEGKVSIIIALITLAGVVISGILKLIGVCIGIYPQLKKLEQKDVDNRPSGINKSPVGPRDEVDDSVSGTEQKKSPRSKIKFLTKAWLLFFFSLLLLSTVIFGALQCFKKETPTNQPVIIDTTNSKKQVLEAQATNVAPSTVETPTNQPVIIDTTNSKKQVLEAQATNVAPSTVETPTNQPVIIDTTNSKKQVLEAQATNVAPSTVEMPPEPKAGEVQKFILPGGVHLEMVYCPAGTFTMGSPDGKSEYPIGSGVVSEAELGRRDEEKPHVVRLSEGFWIGKYEVTQAQYKAITGENLSYLKGDTRPVEMVSWHDSVAFCEKLNQLRIAPAGYRFALPTEAQWEYACRAGKATALNNGKPITSEDGKCRNLDKVGWYGKNSEDMTHLVGQKEPNAWGIYDMHGNVGEWCMDCSNVEKVDGVWLTVTDTYKDGIVDPLCSKGEYRVIRGGGWAFIAGDCRSARRGSSGRRNFGIGFRLALIPVKAGEVETFTLSPGVHLEMVYCPAGTFTMGSPDGKSEYPIGSGVVSEAELGRRDEEKPHVVRLSEGFWIGKYPVTQIQYKAITGENPSYFKGNTRPVEMVSWHDSVAFCEKLNQLRIAPKGYRFVLPTEAQWEYACRAGTTTALNNGKPVVSEKDWCPNLDEVGWFSANANSLLYPVGDKRPNAWGIYDMHGNVGEWCMDCCDLEEVDGVLLDVTDTYKDGIVDPLCSKGEYRVLRGGSWGSFASDCRSASRLCNPSGDRSIGIGFRLALVPE